MVLCKGKNSQGTKEHANTINYSLLYHDKQIPDMGYLFKKRATWDIAHH